MAENVKVIVRCRPMNAREIALKSKNVVLMDSQRCSCSIVHPNDYAAPPKSFTFDGVYFINSTTEQIYNEIAYPLVEGVLEGYNSTVFAYGQTGCGKSFSMQGITDPPSQRGIIPRAFEHLFEAISLVEDIRFLVFASYLEIYNEEIRDLLGTNSKRKLELKENADRGIYVQDLSQHAVGSVCECEALMARGFNNRSVGATLMNADSSRSHTIFSVTVEMMPVGNCLDQTPIRRGKLSLVDLAGSERQAKTGAVGDRLKEANKINLSLSALGNVISALVDGKARHIPYRDSKLTRLLQDSLGGNTKTLMVACLSPADNNYDETLSTLRYANRAKNIHNKPHINEDPKDTMLREYQEEIRKLKQLLEINPNTMLTAPCDALLQGVEDNNNLEEKREYEREMERLREEYKAMHNTKCQVQADFLQLKKQLDQMSQQPEVNETRTSDLNIEDGTIHCVKRANSITAAQQEIIKRLGKMQLRMVGGERAGDKELKEKRLRKKRASERRLATLAEVLASVEDEDKSGLVLGVYDDIHQELRAKTENLRKHKQKVKALEREITDLQSEFESERTDYLETVRRQERQLILDQQIFDKIVPTLRKECNYRNLTAVKSEADWNEETNNWQLPELFTVRTKLPPAPLGTLAKFMSDDGDVSSILARLNESVTPLSYDLLKLEQSEEEDFAGNYFKPKRATELLIRAQEDSGKLFNALGHHNNSNGIGVHSSLSSLTEPQKPPHLFLNNSWSGTQNSKHWLVAADGFHHTNGVHSVRKPLRLEAIPLLERKQSTSQKLELNTLDAI